MSCNIGGAEEIQIGVWNIRGINGKECELEEEFSSNRLDILAITETKKKEQGRTKLGSHIMLYSGIQSTERAKAGVG